MCSGLDPEQNLSKIRHLLKEAKDQGVRAVFLPECFYSMSNGLEPTPHLIDKKNKHYEKIRSLSKDFSLYILGGSAATLFEGKIVNRSFNFDPNGNDLGTYDKNHLFSCELKRGDKEKIIDESAIYTPGKETKIVQAGDLKIGLSICFDLRYPRMYQDYRDDGVNLLSISSAFTVPTGEAHWHTLIRARAIENQCYVVAAAQWGRNNERISTYGHSLIVDPWGEILEDAKEGEKIITACVELGKIDEVRKSIRVFNEGLIP